MATATQKRPVYSTRHGQLDVAVWENEGDQRTFFNVTLKQSYKSGDEWKHTQASFGQHEALGAVKLLDWADTAVQQAIEKKPTADEGKPLASKKRGSLEVAIWQKMTDNGARYRVSLTRNYKDGEEWKHVRVWLLANDCLAAARVLTSAFDAIDHHVAASSSSSFVEAAKDTFDAEVVSTDEDIPF